LLARNSKPIRRGGGGGKSENPAALAGFSSEVGKSGILDFSTERLFPRPFYPQIVPQIPKIMHCLELNALRIVLVRHAIAELWLTDIEN
jgi:hypothetical protein